MAVDTQAKRMSIVGINFLPGFSVFPDEDETVQWRQSIGYSYAGLTSAFEEQRQAFINGLTSSTTPTNGWNNEVRDITLKPKHVKRTSPTVVTVTLPSTGLYDISSQEVVEDTIPASILVTSVSAVVATPTFTIDTVGASTVPVLDEGMLMGGLQALAGGIE